MQFTDKAKALVLGGTGFIGRHVCQAFTEAGHDVLAVARRQGDLRYRFAAMNLAETSTDELAELVAAERPDVVINTIGSIWGAAEQDMWTRCVLPTQRLLDALTTASVRPRLIHLGSMLETAPGQPATRRAQATYSAAKMAATQLVLNATRDGVAGGLVLRVANVAGPGSPEISLLGQVAQSLAKAALNDEVAVVELSPLTSYRDYVDVRDVAEAVLAAALIPVSGKVIDIGSGQAIGVRSLVNLLIEASGVSTRVIERSANGSAPRSTDWIEVDTGPARTLLGWRPRRSLADSVGDFWEATSGRPPVATARI